MANYSGKIVPIGNIIATKRNTAKKGISLKDYYSVKFERIPKERIINKFKNMGSNIKY